MRRRSRGAAASPLLSLSTQARKLSLKESLGWAEGSLKRCAWNSDDDAAIESLDGILRFWDRPVGSRAVCPIELVTQLDLRLP